MTPRLKAKLKNLLEQIVARDPFSGKRLLYELKGRYSLRLSYKDRVVYSIDEDKKIVCIERAKTHYGE